jgi:hypothetical protein
MEAMVMEYQNETHAENCAGVVSPECLEHRNNEFAAMLRILAECRVPNAKR